MNYAKLVTPNSFLGRYMEFMRRQETAYAFDFWCGLWCIACACSRHAYVARPRAPVQLNMYAVLVGDSGVARKTTSVTTAGSLVRQVIGNDVGYLDAKMTAEKLDELLHERTLEHGNAQLCIAIPELAVFLGNEVYTSNMPVLLTDLYDCPSHRHGGGTISRGAIVQRNVWLSFLSASTPIWLMKTVNPNVVEGGFTSRCLFVLANHAKLRIPWPDASDEADDRAWLLSDLRTIHERAVNSDPILLTDGAMTSYSKWYNTRPHSFDPYKRSFESREDAHVLRVAALLCINDDSWRIDHGHIARATRLVAEVKDTSGAIFEGGIIRTKYSAAFDAVRGALLSSGMDPIPRYILARTCRRGLDREQFTSLLEVLHEIGAVQRFMDPLHERGRPAEYYRGTEMLMKRGLGEEVLDKFG